MADERVAAVVEIMPQKRGRPPRATPLVTWSIRLPEPLLDALIKRALCHRTPVGEYIRDLIIEAWRRRLHDKRA